MITAIAIDDEPKALEIINLHTQKVPFIHLTKTFREAAEAINWLHNHPIDLLFLDINMPHISGLKFRGLIGVEPMIIFTTAYAEYAVESYNLQALDYLLKPIPFDRFLQACLKAKAYWQLKKGQVNTKEQTLPETIAANANQHFIYVKSGTKLYKVETATILYLEKDGNYVYFHTSKNKIMSRLNMSQLQELLPKNGFIRVHKSFIIALAHIDILEGHQVTIAGRQIPVAKAYKEVLKERINKLVSPATV